MVVRGRLWLPVRSAVVSAAVSSGSGYRGATDGEGGHVDGDEFLFCRRRHPDWEPDCGMYHRCWQGSVQGWVCVFGSGGGGGGGVFCGRGLCGKEGEGQEEGGGKKDSGGDELINLFWKEAGRSRC